LVEIKTISIVTPVHNEGASIFHTVNEFIECHKENPMKIKFIISEDGSTDNTLDEIQKLKKIYDVTLISDTQRKGYSNAVIDGFKLVNTDIVCFIDSDGQCDPNDLLKLLDKFDGKNIAAGHRKPRKDKVSRIIFSSIFRIFYRLLTNNKLKDPSCPYFVTSTQNIKKILSTENIGMLTQGFWWEFYARAQYLGIDIEEVVINHRKRVFGDSVIFNFLTIPIYAIKNIILLFSLKKILKKINN